MIAEMGEEKRLTTEVGRVEDGKGGCVSVVEALIGIL